MAYEWLEYNETELANVSRTVALARAMGVDTVRVSPSSVAWIADVAPGEAAYGDITTAPWYDPQYPASSEFAGFIPLSVAGLDDSTRESTSVEYITDGGHSGKARNATLPIVANFVIVAKTERGAEYGKRWLSRTLTGESRSTCTGADLRYTRWSSADAPVVHRRDVSLTRGISVTRKRKSACASTWMVTFTMTAADPYEYGEPERKIDYMGNGIDAAGPGVTATGTLTLVETPCAQFDYSPIYDPTYPALVAPPVAPDFLPAGWTITPGDTFERYWARISPVEPSSLNTVPVIRLDTTGVPVEGGGTGGFGLGGFGEGGFGLGAAGAVSIEGARMVRVSVWPSTSAVDDQCDPLFSAVLTYVPPNVPLYVDGEQRATYVWDGYSPVLRRADSLVYSGDANPVQWTAFNDDDGLLVTLDVFDGSDVHVSLSLVPKSD